MRNCSLHPFVLISGGVQGEEPLDGGPGDADAVAQVVRVPRCRRRNGKKNNFAFLTENQCCCLIKGPRAQEAPQVEAIRQEQPPLCARNAATAAAATTATAATEAAASPDPSRQQRPLPQRRQRRRRHSERSRGQQQHGSVSQEGAEDRGAAGDMKILCPFYVNSVFVGGGECPFYFCSQSHKFLLEKHTNNQTAEFYLRFKIKIQPSTIDCVYSFVISISLRETKYKHDAY